MLTKTRQALEGMMINRKAAQLQRQQMGDKGPDESSAAQVALRHLTKHDEALLNTSNWSDASELKLEDKVSVADARAVFLQGLVVFVGKVHFGEGIWVGIQLTGPSIGKGNCDGSFDGKKYFSHVGKNNGVMAPLNKVNKRLGVKTGDSKVDKAQKQRRSERARMADLKFIDCLTQERALAMLKLNEEKKKLKGMSAFDTEETHITRLKQMRIAEIMRSRENAVPEDLEAAEPNLKYSAPGSKLAPFDLEFAEGLEMTQQNYCLSDPTLPDNPIVYASQPFLNMTGYNLNEILGKNCRFLQGNKTDKYAVYRIRLSIKEGADCHVCLANYRKDGTLFYNRLFMTALRCTKGNIKNYLGVQCEVSEKVALRINQEEREKLENRLRDARLSTTIDMSVTERSACSDTNRREDSVSFGETDPLDSDGEEMGSPRAKGKGRHRRTNSFDVAGAALGGATPDAKKKRRKKPKGSSKKSSSKKEGIKRVPSCPDL